MSRTKKVDDQVILKIILDVIVRIGATNFSLEDLSKETKLSPATLLQRFGSKKEILYKALALANKNLIQELETDDIQSFSPCKKIINIYLKLAAGFEKPMDIANRLSMLKLDITDKKLNTLTRDYFSMRQEKIKNLIEQAKAIGELPKNIDSGALVWQLEIFWQGTITLWALIGQDSLRPYLKKQLRNQLFKRTYLSNSRDLLAIEAE